MRNNILALMVAATTCISCTVQSEKLYEKHVVIPQGATSEEIIDIAARVTPTRNQLEWQQMELTAFLHYGINTYTDREWGDYDNYDLSLNTASLGIENCADLIAAIAQAEWM